jgi:HAD superfamily hydrolase (TIGR01509 family)
MTQLKALIFDVDGTLSDTERDGHRVAFNRAFDEVGLNWHWDVETYGKLLEVTGGKERIRHFINEFQPQFDPPADLNEFILKLHKIKTRHFVTLLKSGAIPLRPGVERLLKEARAKGLRLAIATTTTPENITTLLTATLGKDSIGWFDVIAAGDVVPGKKPAPDIYLHALKHMGLSAADCMAFEDSENGLLSSTAAGLKTIVTINGYTRQQNFNGAALVLDQLGEPEAAFSVLAGDAGDATYVDMSLIKRLFDGLP